MIESVEKVVIDEQNYDDSKKFCCCINSSYKRFYALFLIIVSVFFYESIYEMPASMESIIEKSFSILPHEFEYLYTVYTLPNIILCLFSGLLVDKIFGLNKSSIIFMLFAIIGQIITTVGSFTKLYWLMLVGRLLYGIGAETIYLILNCFTVIWFKGKELNFVIGLYMSITRLGSAFAFIISTPAYKLSARSINEGLASGVTTTPYMLMCVIMSASLIILSFFSRFENTSNSDNSFKFKDILKFPLIFWVLIIMVSLCNNVAFGFVSISQRFLQTKYNLNDSDSNYLSSGFNFISALVSPICGLLVDKYGKHLNLTLFSLFLAIISQLIMSLTNWNPWIPITLLGAAFSIFNCCGWPMISYIVEPYQLATAFGALQCLINLISSLLNVIIGIIIEKYGSLGTTFLFLAIFIVSTFCCLLVLYLNIISNGTLNLNANERKALVTPK